VRARPIGIERHHAGAGGAGDPPAHLGVDAGRVARQEHRHVAQAGDQRAPRVPAVGGELGRRDHAVAAQQRRVVALGGERRVGVVAADDARDLVRVVVGPDPRPVVDRRQRDRLDGQLDREPLVADHQLAAVQARGGVDRDRDVEVRHPRRRDRPGDRRQPIGVAAGAAAGPVHRRRRRRHDRVVDREPAHVGVGDGQRHVDRIGRRPQHLDAEHLAARAAQPHRRAVEDRRGRRQVVAPARPRGLGQHLQRRAALHLTRRRGERGHRQRGARGHE
jgi:hypothetical protein